MFYEYGFTLLDQIILHSYTADDATISCLLQIIPIKLSKFPIALVSWTKRQGEVTSHSRSYGEELQRSIFVQIASAIGNLESAIGIISPRHPKQASISTHMVYSVHPRFPMVKVTLSTIATHGGRCGLQRSHFYVFIEQHQKNSDFDSFKHLQATFDRLRSYSF